MEKPAYARPVVSECTVEDQLDPAERKGNLEGVSLAQSIVTLPLTIWIDPYTSIRVCSCRRCQSRGVRDRAATLLVLCRDTCSISIPSIGTTRQIKIRCSVPTEHRRGDTSGLAQITKPAVLAVTWRRRALVKALGLSFSTDRA